MDRILPEEDLRRWLRRPVPADDSSDGFASAVLARIEMEKARRRRRANALALAGLMALALGFAATLAIAVAIVAPRALVLATRLLPLVETAPLWAGIVVEEIGHGLGLLVRQWVPFLAAAAVALAAFEIAALRLFKSRSSSSS